MKKFMKAFMLVFLMFAAVFSFAACGGGNEEPPKDPPGSSDPELPEIPDFTKPDPDENFVIEKDGDYIYFGRYFSSIKPKNVAVSETPDVNGFYKGSDGGKYAKVQFNLGQTWINSTNKFSDGTTFSIKTDYEFYFKCEKLKWRILKQQNNQALILCTSIVDNVAFQKYASQTKSDGKFYIDPKKIDDEDYKAYLEEIDQQDDNKTLENVYANDWEYSYIRYFLNNYFYETAFNELQKALIVKTDVDNSVETTNDVEGYHENLGKYVFNNTQDNVFLLSWKDVYNTELGFKEQHDVADENRMFTNTDYAIARGSFNKDGYGTTWLRSRDRVSSKDNYTMVLEIFYDGKLYGGSDSSRYINGFAPAMWIDISQISE